jgi:hypothetical protein
MSKYLDLNRLRDTVIENQNDSSSKPSGSLKKVFVDNEGKIHEGSSDTSNKPHLSEVPQDTFADRVANEKQIVRRYMPNNTKSLITDEGISGWVYSFTCEFGDNYIMFAYYDGNYYQVSVIEPKVEGKWNSAHTGHIFSSGKICFRNKFDSGLPSLQDAYSKSVLWATGLSVAKRTEHFPFSNNQ